ncbi:hypothetical protein QVO32_02970 [Bacteroides gallinaceum]|jgi:hypothetical protein|uniref:hypothetical protein n=1 Tax=Bacteroides gallinaceum TaxID=1462571 RepID=UPI0025AAE25B|nr:hypothetical protein [Bacteroides gallinaceum]MDN0078373.1 hypothetical protein [Bacteroides gallinaceum]
MKTTLMFLSLAIILLSCNSEKRQNNDVIIGKYLYLTNDGVLHCKQDCVGVILAKDEDGHKVTGMNFIDTLEFTDDKYMSYCTRCFNDARYEQVQRMIRRNDKDRTMPGVETSSKYELIVNGKTYKISKSNIDKYGWNKYSEFYPNATVRMQDESKEDYDIPLDSIERAISEGLNFYISE